MQLRGFRGMSSAAQMLVSGLALSEVGLAVPIEDSPRQYLLAGVDLPAKYSSSSGGGRRLSSKAAAPGPNGPYSPDYRDPLDKAVDAIGEDLDPLPYRNGLGTSVLGPWNRDRSRQNPDLVRPPSTDRGDMPNLRWSFADSHVRIEVSRRKCTLLAGDLKSRFSFGFFSNVGYRELLGRRMDTADHGPGARRQRRAR